MAWMGLLHQALGFRGSLWGLLRPPNLLTDICSAPTRCLRRPSPCSPKASSVLVWGKPGGMGGAGAGAQGGHLRSSQAWPEPPRGQELTTCRPGGRELLREGAAPALGVECEERGLTRGAASTSSWLRSCPDHPLPTKSQGSVSAWPRAWAQQSPGARKDSRMRARVHSGQLGVAELLSAAPRGRHLVSLPQGATEKSPDSERACSKVRFNKQTGKNRFYHTILFHSLL